MRALTLTQPWAGLVASGMKLIENRSRVVVRRSDIGLRFAIHASRENDEAVYSRIAQIAPELDIRMVSGDGAWPRLSHITGAVIAVATLERVVKLRKELHGDHERAFDYYTGELVDLGDQRRWFFGPIGYVLRDVRPLDRFVPCRGWQGFWALSPDLARRVEEETPA